jgi:hypothetical protein
MSLEAFPAKSADPELVTYDVRFVGGTNAITEVTGTSSGVVTSYVSAGRVKLTWGDNPGTFVNAVASFQATTPDDIKAYVGIFGAYSTTAFTLELYMFESGTLTNLAALEWGNIRVSFKRTGVSG